jgi:acetyltransferase-like isoleucine patch superfamily enzyme
VGRGCRLFLDPGASLRIGQGCQIDDGATIAVYTNAQIVLGPRSFVGHHATLAAYESVEIGAGAFLAEMVSIRDHDHAVGSPPSTGDMTVTPVVVGDDVWIGAKATVLRGVNVGAGAVVGANAVVRGPVPARALVAGVPARVVRMLDA